MTASSLLPRQLRLTRGVHFRIFSQNFARNLGQKIQNAHPGAMAADTMRRGYSVPALEEWLRYAVEKIKADGRGDLLYLPDDWEV